MNSGSIKLDIKQQDLLDLDFQKHFSTYRQTPETELYYVDDNSSIWQIFNDECPQWLHDLKQQVPQDFDHSVVSVIKIDPGNTIPWHLDLHTLIQERYGAGDTHRYLIFLEDWKTGHYFQREQTPFVNWQAGDWVKFSQPQWHVAGNMGLEPFYTAQVTTVKL